jgi:hypothetical protein
MLHEVLRLEDLRPGRLGCSSRYGKRLAYTLTRTRADGAAQALNTATFVCVKLRTTYGLGKHTLVIYMNLDNALKMGRVLYFQSLLMMLGNSAVKISIALTLLRLSSQGTSKYSNFLWSSIVFLVLMTIGCGGSLLFQCISPISAAWDYAERSPPFGKGTAKCYSKSRMIQVSKNGDQSVLSI